MFEKALTGGRLYWGWITLLLVFIVVGVIFYIQHADQGDFFPFLIGCGLLEQGDGIDALDVAHAGMLCNMIKIVIAKTSCVVLTHISSYLTGSNGPLEGLL